MVWARNGTSNTLASEQDDMDITDLSGLTFNQFLIHKLATGSGHVRVTFNNDGTSSYAGRSSYNGGTDSTYKSDASFRIDDNGGVDGFGVIKAIGISGEEQLAICHWISANTEGSSFAPTRFESVFKLDTGGTITRIDLNNPSTGGYLANSNLSALGADVTEEPILGNDVQSGSRFEATDTRKIYYRVLPSVTFEHDYSNSTGWTEVGTTTNIIGGVWTSNSAGNNADHGFYKALGFTLDNEKWYCEFDIKQTGSGSLVESGVPLFFSTGTAKPLDGSHSALGIIANNGGAVELWANTAGTSSTTTGQTAFVYGTQYYGVLIRTSATNLQLKYYTDSARTQQYGSTTNKTISSAITGLTTIQHRTTDNGGTSSGASNIIDNVKVYNGVTSTTDLVWTEEV